MSLTIYLQRNLTLKFSSLFYEASYFFLTFSFAYLFIGSLCGHQTFTSRCLFNVFTQHVERMIDFKSLLAEKFHFEFFPSLFYEARNFRNKKKPKNTKKWIWRDKNVFLSVLDVFKHGKFYESIFTRLTSIFAKVVKSLKSGFKEKSGIRMISVRK